MSNVQDTEEVKYEPFDPAELVLSTDAEEGTANSNIPRAKFIVITPTPSPSVGPASIERFTGLSDRLI